MKKYLLILFVSMYSSISLMAQDGVENTPDAQRGGKLMERMQQYIQNRLNMTKAESERFSPVFLRYISELRRTHRENINDKPVLQLRIAEVRVKFRNEFRQVVDEQRANRVFKHQKEFEDIVRREIEERKMQPRRVPARGARFVNPQKRFS
jgi:ribosomal protein L16 Arg81 hydroxylase